MACFMATVQVRQAVFIPSLPFELCVVFQCLVKYIGLLNESEAADYPLTEPMLKARKVFDE